MRKETMRLIVVSSLPLLVAACGEVVGPEAAGGGTPPTITEISPDHGPVVGGAEITITGSDFQANGAGEAFVVVDGFLAPTTTIVDDATVTFELPAGVQEGDQVDVTLFNGNGQARVEDAFRYNERPIVIDIAPKRGRGAGGTLITITGRGFEEFEAGEATVVIDGVAATDVTVVDDQTITATTGANTASVPFEPLDVVVANANGETSLEGGFLVTLPGIIVIQRQGTIIYYYHPPTETLKELSRATESLGRTCAKPAAGASLYTVRGRPSDFLWELATFDPLSGVVSPIGVTTDGGNNRNIGSIAMSGTTLYGIANRINRGSIATTLLTINTTNGVTTPAAGVAVPQSSRGIALKDASSFWFLDRLNESLDTMSTAGAVTAGPALTGGDTSKVHGAVVFGGDLYVNDSGIRIWKVNTTSGALTEVARVPFTIGGICETPSTF
jgi:hypothetical protein